LRLRTSHHLIVPSAVVMNMETRHEKRQKESDRRKNAEDTRVRREKIEIRASKDERHEKKGTRDKTNRGRQKRQERLTAPGDKLVPCVVETKRRDGAASVVGIVQFVGDFDLQRERREREREENERGSKVS
jgi:hypothetical protein